MTLDQEISISALKEIGKKKKKKNSVLKTEINFVDLTSQKKKNYKMIPVYIILAILIVVFIKFAIADRYFALFDARVKLANIQADIMEANARLNSSAEIRERYDHYTISGMTDEERDSLDCAEVMEIIPFIEKRGIDVKSVSVNANEFSASVEADDLKSLSRLSSDLEAEAVVSSVNVTTAQTLGSSEEGVPDRVVASVTIYLRSKSEVEEGGAG